MTPDEIKRHLEKLYSYASPRITDHLELDDILSNTFSTALKTGGQFEETDKHDLALLIGILRKQIRLHYQEKYRSDEAIAKTQRKVKEILDSPFNIPEQISGLKLDVLSQSGDQSFWNAFKECVEMLDEVHSDIFILRDLEDISVEELSGIFGLKQSDVIELTYRARMTVIACLVRIQKKS